MRPQQLPEVSQLAFLLALARTLPHRSPAMDDQPLPHKPSDERALQEALRVLGIDVNTEDRE